MTETEIVADSTCEYAALTLRRRAVIKSKDWYTAHLARLAKLPEGYIFYRCFFFNFSLMVDFLALVAQTLMEQSSPKFQDW